MAQHDMNIANQGFPAFRSDLNDALAALVSTSSGATAPTTTFANQLWYDTANDKLKIRNEANDGWIEVVSINQTTGVLTTISGTVIATPTITGAASFPDGSASAPSVTNTGDTNTGMYFPAADEVAITAGGTVAAAFNSHSFMGMRNRIINGDMRIDQRNAGASVAIPAANPVFTLDRWAVFEDTAGSMSAQRVTDAPPNFTNALRVTVTGASGSLSASQRALVFHPLEGNNVSDLAFGTSSAKTVTVSFWVKSSLTGTFGGSLTNYVGTRSYAFTYSVASANTWEQKTVTIPGDTTGTWAKDNTGGMTVVFGMGVGTSYGPTPGSWISGDANGAAGCVNLLATNGATWAITGVQLEVGSVATPFERRQYGQELALCQRYFSKSYNIDVAPATVTNVGALASFSPTASSNRPVVPIFFPVSMRTTPTLTAYSTNNGASGNFYNSDAATNFAVGFNVNTGSSGTSVYPTASLTANAYFLGHWTASAEL